jgi:hypothetical protein
MEEPVTATAFGAGGAGGTAGARFIGIFALVELACDTTFFSAGLFCAGGADGVLQAASSRAVKAVRASEPDAAVAGFIDGLV